MRLHILPTLFLTPLLTLYKFRQFTVQQGNILYRYDEENFPSIRSYNTYHKSWYRYHVSYRINKDILNLLTAHYKFTKYIFLTRHMILIQCESKTVYKELKFFDKEYVTNKKIIRYKQL